MREEPFSVFMGPLSTPGPVLESPCATLPGMSALPAEDDVRFLVHFAQALHDYGSAAHQVEDALAGLARRLNVPAQFLATPTSIIFSFGNLAEQRLQLLRLEPGENDLGRLARTIEVGRAVLHAQLTPAAATARLEAIGAAAPLYGALPTTVAFGLSSAAAARFLGGGGFEVAAAAGIGILVRVLAALCAPFPGMARLLPAVAAALASAAAVGLDHALGTQHYLATVAGIIMLIPGLTLTVACTELANRHLVAGTARLSGAIVTLAMLVVGVALGVKAASSLLGAPPAVLSSALPSWTLVAALIAAPLAFTVLLDAELRDAPWILLTCGLGYGGMQLGARALGPELGAFVGSFIVGLAGTLFGALLRRPTAIVRVPGLLLLVPGSMAFRGATALFDLQMDSGLQIFVRVLLTAVALAAGLLVASVVKPARLFD